MHASGVTDPLLAALDELSALCGEADHVGLDSLRGRLRQRRLRVLVAGEAKRGKSTLVNALLGWAVLPVGVTPLTSLATTVRYAPDESVTAVFRDGRVENFPLSALDDLVTERGNPGDRRKLASATVVANAPVLARGVELVDTPGTGSVYAHNTAEAEAVLESMDAAVFVLTADPAGVGERTGADGPRGRAVGHHVRGLEQGGLPGRIRHHPGEPGGVQRGRCWRSRHGPGRWKRSGVCRCQWRQRAGRGAGSSPPGSPARPLGGRRASTRCRRGRLFPGGAIRASRCSRETLPPTWSGDAPQTCGCR